MIFLIHTCPKRLWYVEEFLVPSLKEQGILEGDIFIYNDANRDGNLVSCMKSFLYYSGAFPNERDIWNLQDDILLCRDFYKRCSTLSSAGWDIVMGYCSEGYPDRDCITFPTISNHLWWSAPCMKLTAEIMGLISDRFWKVLPTNKKYLLYHTIQKCDDVMINDWIGENLKNNIKIMQVSPNLVDHVDYIIGGSLVNAQRPSIAKSKDFVDSDLVDILRKDIERRGIN